ncbi:uncharacterized protein [Littorina saxatilis]|uniref:uncharacterized protein isoform X2 n=1 Tax=Littorina saxatilis TaxID=31220 RepID=UPI0038B42009
MASTVIHEVTIIFRVHAPFANSRDRVWLLGSLRELGEWNPARAIETGQVESEWKVFQARVRLPVDAYFQWSWCALFKDGRLRRWESSQKRERRISSFSGVLHTAWGDPTVEIFKQNMASVNLNIEKRTKKADVMAVVGSSIPLGSWDTSKAVVASEFPLRSGHWSVTVYYDAGSMQEWNWVIISKDKKEVKLAEKRPTRFLYNTLGWMKLIAQWNKDAAVVEWAPKDVYGGGDPDHGTVELLGIRKGRLLEIRCWEEAAEARRKSGGKAEPKPASITATLQLDSHQPRPHHVAPPTSADTRAGGQREHDRTTETMQTHLLPELEDSYQPTLMVKPYRDKATEDKAREQQTTSPCPFHDPYQQHIRSPVQEAINAERHRVASPVAEVEPETDISVGATLTSPYQRPLPEKLQSHTPPTSPCNSSSGMGTQPNLDTPLTTTTSPPKPHTVKVEKFPKPKTHAPTHDTGVGSDALSRSKDAELKASIQAGRKAAAETMRGARDQGVTSRRTSSHSMTGFQNVPVQVAVCKGSAVTPVKQPPSLSPSNASILSKASTASGRRSLAGVPVDMSKAGYMPDPQCPIEGKDGRSNLVSDPGRPGYSMYPDDFGPAVTPDVGCPMIDSMHMEHKADIRERHVSVDSRSPSSPRMSPPVQAVKRGKERQPDSVSIAGSNTSLVSTVGILGVCEKDKPPSLEDLRTLSLQREQQRTSERIREIRTREERNKTKFEDSKQFEFLDGPGSSAPKQGKKTSKAEFLDGPGSPAPKQGKKTSKADQSSSTSIRR